MRPKEAIAFRPSWSPEETRRQLKPHSPFVVKAFVFVSVGGERCLPSAGQATPRPVCLPLRGVAGHMKYLQ